MVEEGISELLSRFGLSDKEVDTYLTLLEHGEAKASEITADADISKRHVYSVSEELEQKGFVEVKSHSVPTTIRAYPPDEVIEELQEDIDAMGPQLMELYTEPEPSREQIEVVKSRATVLKRMQTLIKEAESEVALSIPETYLEKVADELRDAVERGVLVVLVVSNTDEEPSLDGCASVARQWAEVMPTILSVDSQRGVFAPTELLLHSNSDRQGIVFVQDQLGPVIVGSFFGNYWPMTDEVLTAEPVSLPATFTSFRHAVLQATLHKRAGVNLRAEVTGRKTDSPDDERILTGEILGVTQGLVKPTNNDFPVEHSILLDSDEGTVSIGGQGAFVEEFEADTIRLEQL